MHKRKHAPRRKPRITGHGLYSTTSYNSLFAGKRGGVNPPSLSSSIDESGSLRICHKEYFADFFSSTGFVNNDFSINPGNNILFPWLSNIAANYEEYHFEQLIFEYRTLTSDLSTTATQIGSCSMACDYNAGNSPFGSLAQMLNYAYALSDKISNNIMLGVECDPRKNGLGPVLYINNSSQIPTGQDVKTYNMGLLQIASNGCVNNGANIGQLWVHYCVRLMKPKVSGTSNYTIPGFILNSSVSTSPQFFNMNPFGLGILANPFPSTYGTTQVPLYFSPSFLLSSTANSGVNWTAIPTTVNGPLGGTISQSLGIENYVCSWIPLGSTVSQTGTPPTVTYTPNTSLSSYLAGSVSAIYGGTAATAVSSQTTSNYGQFWFPSTVFVRIRLPDSASGCWQVTLAQNLVANGATVNANVLTSANCTAYPLGSSTQSAGFSNETWSCLVVVNTSAIGSGLSGPDTCVPASVVTVNNVTTDTNCIAVNPLVVSGTTNVATTANLRGTWVSFCLQNTDAYTAGAFVSGINNNSLLVTQLASSFSGYAVANI